jgi:hypothetical protein
MIALTVALFVVAQTPDATTKADAPKADAAHPETPDLQVAQPILQPGLPIGPTTPLGERKWYERFTPFGYAKIGLFYTVPFQNEQLVGSNGGFRMANLRLGVQFDPIEDFSVVVSIEAAAPVVNTSDPTTGTRIVELRDAYLEYRLFKALWFRAGQFKAPYNAETLLDDAQLPFVTRSIATLGIAPPEGNVIRNGLAQDRQIGVEITSDRLGTDAIGFKYALAVVNGNGANQLFNSTNAVEPAGRVELDFFKHVSLGLNAYYNTVAQGIRPNRIDVSQLGYGVDIGMRFGGFSALIGGLGHKNWYSADILPSDNSWAAMAQVHYLFESIGLEAGVRFAFLEPSTAQTNDQLNELAVMLGYRFKKVPMRIMVQYTHNGEEPAVAIDNDAIDAMVSVAW